MRRIFSLVRYTGTQNFPHFPIEHALVLFYSDVFSFLSSLAFFLHIPTQTCEANDVERNDAKLSPLSFWLAFFENSTESRRNIDRDIA
jgi:hypothetical protein